MGGRHNRRTIGKLSSCGIEIHDFVTRYVKNKPEPEVAHKTGSRSFFAKKCASKFLLRNFDQEGDVSSKSIFEKRKFRDVLEPPSKLLDIDIFNPRYFLFQHSLLSTVKYNM